MNKKLYDILEFNERKFERMGYNSKLIEIYYKGYYIAISSWFDVDTIYQLQWLAKKDYCDMLSLTEREIADLFIEYVKRTYNPKIYVEKSLTEKLGSESPTLNIDIY